MRQQERGQEMPVVGLVPVLAPEQASQPGRPVQTGGV